MQQLLAIVILVNYLAVLLPANLSIPTTEKVVAKPYIHTENCQRNNYLQIDCWDKCNDNLAWHHPEKKAPLEQVNLQTFSLDIHFLPKAFTLKKTLQFSLFFAYFPTANPIGSDGFLSHIFPPPKLN